MANKALSRSALMAALFVSAVYIYQPFLAPYLINLGFTKELISLIFAVTPFTLILTAAVLGKLADDIGRKTIINVALLLQSGAILLYLFVQNNTIILIAATALAAIGFSAYELTLLQKVEDSIRNRRGRMTGLFESAVSGGQLIGPLLAVGILTFLPLQTTLKISLAVMLMLLVLNAALKDEGGRGGVAHAKDFNFIDGIKKFWRIRSLRGMGIMGAAAHFTQPAVTIFIPLFIVQELGADVRAVGWFAAVTGTAYLFQFIGGIISDRLGSSRVVIYSFFFSAIFMFALCGIRSVNALLLLGLFLGLSKGFWNTSAWTYMSEVGEQIKKEGAVTGSYMSLAKIGGIAGYILSGAMAAFFDIRVLFAVYAAIMLLAILAGKKYFVQTLRLSPES